MKGLTPLIPVFFDLVVFCRFRKYRDNTQETARKTARNHDGRNERYHVRPQGGKICETTPFDRC